MPTEVEMAWAAGLFEGEGYVSRNMMSRRTEAMDEVLAAWAPELLTVEVK